MRSFICILLIISGFSFGQKTDSTSIKYDEAVNRYDSFNEPIANIERLKNSLPAFEKSYNKLLEIEDFSNIKLQKIITSDFRADYGDIFLRKENNKSYYLFPLSFKSKSDLIEFIGIGKEIIQIQTILEINDLITKSINAFESKNLKRLGITQKEFDALSDKDKELIYEKFE